MRGRGSYIASITIHHNDTPRWFIWRRAQGLPCIEVILGWWSLHWWYRRRA